MGALEDDLTEHPPRYAEPERKVHLFHDNKGATFGPRHKPFANTLCRMNSTNNIRTTNNAAEVTCKICRRDHRFRAIVDPSPVGDVVRRRTRYRVSLLGRLVLQVEDVRYSSDPQPPHEVTTRRFWRDARVADLQSGLIYGRPRGGL